jgi:hypothetical protein
MQYPRVIHVPNAPEGAWVMGVIHEGIMGVEFTVMVEAQVVGNH